MAFENRALVIDNGSLCSKAGFAGNDVPKAIFSTVLRRAGHQNLDSPMDQGIVRDWASMEMVWNHAFNDQLCVDPTKQPILLTESPFNPRQNREKTAEIMFETFDVPALCITNQAVLSLYAAGLTTGTVVDCGDSVTFVAPVHEGRSISRMVHRLDMAGRTVDHTLDALLKPFSHILDASPQSGVVRSVKEELCFVAQDFDEEAKNSRTSQQTKTFTLPDGQKITLNDERFRAPEVLFKPALFNQESQAIHEATNYAISRCDIDIRPDLYRNVVLTGGTSALDGFTGRMEMELMALAPRNTMVRVVASPASKHAAWTGGSIFAALPTFTNSCVTREEFAEHGAEIFENKCAVIA